MKKQASLVLVLTLSLLVQVFGQRPVSPSASPQQQQADDDDEVVRITTNLVQVDAVVTDGDGKQVTDLRPEEIEILEDGRAQKISNFSYIATQPALANQPAAPIASPSTARVAPPPPLNLRPEQVRRTIALVIDDLGLSFESTAQVRGSLKKFVNEQMEANDLVAIIRTSAGAGALQQFTSDKRLLYAAIERVRWYPMGGGGVSAFAPLERDPTIQFSGNANEKAARLARTSEKAAEEASEERNQLREELFAVGTLGALSFVVRGLRELPGRKSILLFSDGLQLLTKIKSANRRSGENSEGSSQIKDSPSDNVSTNTRVLEALQRLTDQANRSSVVIYTMDARGLQTLSLKAEDNASDSSAERIEQQLFDRRQEFFNTQSGLEYLSRLTGGFAIRDSNDLNKGIRRVLDDQSGYYLIGYRPDEATFNSAGRSKFHRVTVRAKRPGLRVRSRSGFYGVENKETRPGDSNSRESMMVALASPFNSGDLRVRLTSLFGNDQRTGSVMYSMLHIDGRDLTFKETKEGWQTAAIDVAAYTFGSAGDVVNSFNERHTIEVRGDTYNNILHNGLIYTINLPVKKAGAYQLRVAVRDTDSKRVGSASQFIEVPDIARNRLTLSGLVVMGIDPKSKDTANASVGGNGQNTEEEEADAQSSPAVRRLKGGMALRYVYTIYNAQLDGSTRRPRLQTQVRLFRDGKEVYTGKPTPYEMDELPNLTHLRAGGRIQLGKDAPPGEYMLQVIVTDALAKEEYRTVTQWIDFEIVK